MITLNKKKMPISELSKWYPKLAKAGHFKASLEVLSVLKGETNKIYISRRDDFDKGYRVSGMLHDVIENFYFMDVESGIYIMFDVKPTPQPYQSNRLGARFSYHTEMRLLEYELSKPEMMAWYSRTIRKGYFEQATEILSVLNGHQPVEIFDFDNPNYRIKSTFEMVLAVYYERNFR